MQYFLCLKFLSTHFINQLNSISIFTLPHSYSLVYAIFVPGPGQSYWSLSVCLSSLLSFLDMLSSKTAPPPQMTVTGLMVMFFSRTANRKGYLVSILIYALQYYCQQCFSLTFITITCAFQLEKIKSMLAIKILSPSCQNIVSSNKSVSRSSCVAACAFSAA